MIAPPSPLAMGMFVKACLMSFLNGSPKDMLLDNQRILNYLDITLTNYSDSGVLVQVKKAVYNLCKAFPVYK